SAEAKRASGQGRNAGYGLRKLGEVAVVQRQLADLLPGDEPLHGMFLGFHQWGSRCRYGNQFLDVSGHELYVDSDPIVYVQDYVVSDELLEPLLLDRNRVTAHRQ